MDYIDHLVQHNWCTIRDRIPSSLVTELYKESEGLFKSQQFKQAAIGKSETVEQSIRSDNILWFDDNNPSIIQQRYLSCIDEIRNELNEALYLGAASFECHYAVYPAGSFYKRHIDNFHHSSERVLSCILYLNDSWSKDQGGELRIYTDSSDNIIEILPEAGTLVLFRSELLEHEVLAAKRERYSVTGWLRKNTSHII